MNHRTIAIAGTIATACVIPQPTTSLPTAPQPEWQLQGPTLRLGNTPALHGEWQRHGGRTCSSGANAHIQTPVVLQGLCGCVAQGLFEGHAQVPFPTVGIPGGRA